MQQTSNKFETSEQFHPTPVFQNGRAEFITNMLQKGDYMCNLDLKNAYFCVPLKKESRKYVWLQWEGTLTLYEFLSLLWSRSSSSNIYQNFKGTKFALEKASGSCDNVSGRYVTHVTDT